MFNSKWVYFKSKGSRSKVHKGYAYNEICSVYYYPYKGFKIHDLLITRRALDILNEAKAHYMRKL